MDEVSKNISKLPFLISVILSSLTVEFSHVMLKSVFPTGDKNNEK